MDELMLLLDELQYIHDDLDQWEIPTTGKDGLLMSLQHRVTYLIRQSKYSSGCT